MELLDMNGKEAELSVSTDKIIPDPDNPGTVWVELEPHLRLIFRNGLYAGFYDPLLPKPV